MASGNSATRAKTPGNTGPVSDADKARAAAETAQLNAMTPEQRAQAAGYMGPGGQYTGIGSAGNMPEAPWWQRGLDYAGDAATGGPAQRLAGFAANGDWSNFGAQAGNMGGTPFGAHIFGQADGQPLAPNSGAYAPAATRAGSPGEFAGRAVLGFGQAVSGGAVVGGAVNLANGGDKSGGSGGMANGTGTPGDINAAANEILGYGKQNAAAYQQAGQQALGYYNPAQQAYNDTYGGGSYQGPQGPGANAAGGVAGLPQMTQAYQVPGAKGTTSPFGSPTSGKSGAPNPWAPPTQQQSYNQGAQQRLSAPTAAQQYYAAYQPTAIAQGAYSDRQANGYGQSAVQDRYQQQLGAQNDPTATGNMINQLAGYNPTERGDAFSGNLSGMTVDQNAAGAQQRIASGQTQSGQLGSSVMSGQTPSGQFLNQLMSGNSATGQYGSYLNSGNSDTGKFLAGFDPNSTQALGANYQKLNAMGPTYEENFYNSQVAGNNPAYNQLKSDFVKDTERADAARGGFVSGHSMDYEQRGLDRLDADEFANRGTLAQNAGNAQRAQAGLVSTAANNLDTNLLARQGLVQKAGADREGILGSLATNRDTVTGSTVNAQEDLLGKLAQSGDQNYATLAADRDASNLQKQNILSGVATAGDTARLGLENTKVSAASNQDQALQARVNANNSLANNASEDQLNRGKALDALAGVASGESISNAQTGGQLARNTDISATDQENARRLAAEGASGEQAANIKTKFDEALRLGDSQSAISMAASLASIGALSQSQMAALNARVAAMGISAADRQALTAAEAQGGAAFVGLLQKIFASHGGGSGGGSSGGSSSYGGGIPPSEDMTD